MPNVEVQQIIANHPALAGPKVLLVDDTASVLSSLKMVLQHSGFEVVAAASVKEALQCINTQQFDVLLSDLHMPNAGDGLTLVSAMRHANPDAVTIIFSGYPEMKEAAAAILLQADEILVKPLDPKTLLETIRTRLKRGSHSVRKIESVADILERETPATIAEWELRVDDEKKILCIPLSSAERCAHLPQLFRDLVSRLRSPLPLGTRALVSKAAAAHGKLRRKQGYTAAMMVEESRMLQVSIFEALQNNLRTVNFSLLLLDVMAIADEVDSQLAQAMACYILESKGDNLLVEA
ncbi:MAG TPA: response regulator [Acidobacteriaceae bacterium]|nr:response regulator [Acidobacteriaceae bacterium]